jgi:hypothetical protein
MSSELKPDRLWLAVVLVGLAMYAGLGTVLIVFAVAR